MTLSKIWEKLRKKNKNQYRQLLFCVGFAMMLITSYLMMLMSPLIQQTLPEGGDSRKQVYMIFALAAVGCIVFVSYAAGLFLRYKSRETGVLLALGADKKACGQSVEGRHRKMRRPFHGGGASGRMYPLMDHRHRLQGCDVGSDGSVLFPSPCLASS